MLTYKLTDRNYRTRAGHTNSLTWDENVTHTVSGNNPKLCSDSWIHFYTHSFLASLMNCNHANIYNPILWECLVDGEIKHETLKSGCKQLTTVKIIPMPEYSLTSKIAFAILIVKQVYKCSIWNKWADNWLNGTDRSEKAAHAAANADIYAASAAANAAAVAAVAAANAAVAAANATYATAVAADAADAAAYAAHVATYATAAQLNILPLINQALEIK